MTKVCPFVIPILRFLSPLYNDMGLVRIKGEAFQCKQFPRSVEMFQVVVCTNVGCSFFAEKSGKSRKILRYFNIIVQQKIQEPSDRFHGAREISVDIGIQAY